MLTQKKLKSSSSEDRMIVAWVILTQCQRVTERQRFCLHTTSASSALEVFLVDDSALYKFTFHFISFHLVIKAFCIPNYADAL